jgi:hypothetical protein
VTEQLLDGPQVGPAIEQVRGERVAQRVGMGGRRRSAIEDATHVARCQAAAPLVEEQRVVVGRPLRPNRHVRPTVEEPRAHCIGGWGRQGYSALTATLAPYGDHARPDGNVAAVERAELGHAQPTAVQQLEYGVVAGPHRR